MNHRIFQFHKFVKQFRLRLMRYNRNFQKIISFRLRTFIRFLKNNTMTAKRNLLTEKYKLSSKKLNLLLKKLILASKKIELLLRKLNLSSEKTHLLFKKLHLSLKKLNLLTDKPGLAIPKLSSCQDRITLSEAVSMCKYIKEYKYS
jgi:hypothetical protein